MLSIETLENRTLLTGLITPTSVELLTAAAQGHAGTYTSIVFEEYTPDALVSSRGLIDPDVETELTYLGSGHGVAMILNGDGDFMLDFVMESPTDIESFVAWNSVWLDTDRSVRNLELDYFSGSQVAAEQAITLDRGELYSPGAQVFDLDVIAEDVTRVRMTIVDNYGAPLTSLSKVRFGEADPFVNALGKCNQGVTFHNDVGYCSSTDIHGHDMISFDPNTGRLLQQYEIGWTYDHTPHAFTYQGVDYVVGHEFTEPVPSKVESGRSRIFNARTGQQVAETESMGQRGNMFLEYAQFDRDELPPILYVSTQYGLNAFDALSGESLWTRPGHSGITPAVDQANGVLYHQERFQVHKLDAMTGELLASSERLGKEFSFVGAWSVELHAGKVATKWVNTSRWDEPSGGAVRVYDTGLHLEWELTALPTGKKHTLQTWTDRSGRDLISWGIGAHGRTEPHDLADPEGEWKAIVAYDIHAGTVAWRSELPELTSAVFNLSYDADCNRLVFDSQYAYGRSDYVFVVDASTGDRMQTIDLGRAITSCAISVYHSGHLWSGDILGDELLSIEIS